MKEHFTLSIISNEIIICNQRIKDTQLYKYVDEIFLNHSENVKITEISSSSILGFDYFFSSPHYVFILFFILT